MELDTVLFQVQDGICVITLNRPEARNALNQALMDDLLAALERVRRDPDVRVAVLTGAGSAFCAGWDLGGAVAAGSSLIEQHFMRGKLVDFFQAISDAGKPLIAAVNGPAVAGGMGLALACDLVVASEDARFGMPEVNVGLFPMMIMALVFRHMGRKKGLELMYTGRSIDAREAESLGLVNRVVPGERLMAEVLALARELAQKSPVILRLGREAFYGMEDMDLPQALTYLQGMLTLCTLTEDAREGMTAFLEKRQPQWKGR